jgi:hypothetical protein
MRSTRLRHQALMLILTLLTLTALGALTLPRLHSAPAARNPHTVGPRASFDQEVSQHVQQLLEEGRQIFRFDTFGDEVFWGETLKLHEALAQVSPNAALALGLKVDLDALPADVMAALRDGAIDLDDPAVTLALLQLKAVLGVTGFFNGQGQLRSVGIQCALCHSRVDDAFRAPGIPAGTIGHRLDGWANRDLDVGAIIALAPDLRAFSDLLEVDEATVRRILTSWGPGKFDAQLILDGKGFRPDGKTAAVLIPPAFGLAGVNLHTWTGAWGTVTYWNALVANLEMHGQGTFFDPRLDDPVQFPVAARNGLGHVRNEPDLISAKLPALHFYQLALPAPTPPPGSFDPHAAARGDALFSGRARCATCHVEPVWTEPGRNLHTADEIGIDDFQANRAPDQRYRTAPLNGLWTHQQGGFYHDGRFATLLEVVTHYDRFFGLGLSDRDKRDLVEYLKSLPSASEAAGRRRTRHP